MEKVFKKEYTENIIYIIIWGLMILFPVFLSTGQYELNWRRVFHEWIRLIPFLLVFILNNSLLVPKLLFQKHYAAYIIITLAILFFVSYLSQLDSFLKDWVRMNIEAGSLPHEVGMPDPGNRPLPEADSGYGMRPEPFRQRPPAPVYKMILNNFGVSFLVVAFNIAVKFAFRWIEEERLRRKLEQENLKTQLAFLKHQISPHFFMNTLNNIHALVDIDTEDAKSSIIRLSKMMRYFLYDSEQGRTTIKREMEFIESYIELMGLRFSDDLDIRVETPENIPALQIPALLFLTFVENAFKHGVKEEGKSFIHFDLTVDESNLCASIKNSKGDRVKGVDSTGIGLKNSVKRLDLIYNDNYVLDIKDSENEFEIILKLPLNNSGKKNKAEKAH